MAIANDHWVTSKARARQLALDEKMDNLVVQIENKMNDQLASEAVFSGLEQTSPKVEISDIVGRWTASREIVLGSVGLLTDEEQDLLRIFFEEQSGLLR